MKGRHVGPRPIWFRRTREARRVLDLAADLKFPTHRKAIR